MTTKSYRPYHAFTFAVTLLATVLFAMSCSDPVDPVVADGQASGRSGRIPAAAAPSSLTSSFRSSSLVAAYNAYGTGKWGTIDWSTAVEGTNRDGYRYVRVRTSVASVYINGIWVHDYGKFAFWGERVNVNAYAPGTHNYTIEDFTHFGDAMGTRIIEGGYLTRMFSNTTNARSSCQSQCYVKVKQQIEATPGRDIACSALNNITFDVGCKAIVWFRCAVECS